MSESKERLKEEIQYMKWHIKLFIAAAVVWAIATSIVFVRALFLKSNTLWIVTIAFILILVGCFVGVGYYEAKYKNLKRKL